MRLEFRYRTAPLAVAYYNGASVDPMRRQSAHSDKTEPANERIGYI